MAAGGGRQGDPLHKAPLAAERARSRGSTVPSCSRPNLDPRVWQGGVAIHTQRQYARTKNTPTGVRERERDLRARGGASSAYRPVNEAAQRLPRRPGARGRRVHTESGCSAPRTCRPAGQDAAPTCQRAGTVTGAAPRQPNSRRLLRRLCARVGVLQIHVESHTRRRAPPRAAAHTQRPAVPFPRREVRAATAGCPPARAAPPGTQVSGCTRAARRRGCATAAHLDRADRARCCESAAPLLYTRAGGAAGRLASLCIVFTL